MWLRLRKGNRDKDGDESIMLGWSQFRKDLPVYPCWALTLQVKKKKKKVDEETEMCLPNGGVLFFYQEWLYWWVEKLV